MYGTIITNSSFERDDVAGKKIGVIGLGRMGEGIALSLLRNKVEVVSCVHHNRQGIDTILTMGGKEVASPKEVAELCDTIILCLPSSQEVDQVCRGEKSLLCAKREDLLIIDTTTGHPNESSGLVNALKISGIQYVDAPLTRGPAEARRGQLNAMLGAPLDLVKKVSNVLLLFCEFVIHVGEVGTAQKMKLINNALSMGIVALTAEIIQMAKTLDVEIGYLSKLIERGGVNNALSQSFFKWAIEQNPDILPFSIGNACKDLGYCLSLFETEGHQFNIVQAAYDRYEEKVKAGYGSLTLPHILSN